MGKGGSRVRVIVKIIYYIITKIFNFKKKTTSDTQGETLQRRNYK